MAKILVADDETDIEALIKQKFRHKIKDNLYEFVFAVNGKDALDKLVEHPDIDMVLSDINMPEMDGLTLLSHLSEESPLIKSVIVSAYGDMDNIRTAMNRGAFDFITKPINFDDLSLTLEKTISHVKQIRETIMALKENNILKMYVDENVLKFMGSREFESALTETEMVDATVVFIDICGFTSISETETPTNVVKLLNSYFDTMTKEIIKGGGYIDKFIGDAIMAVFRGGNHPSHALKSMLDVREAISKLQPIEGALSYKPDVSIGVNTGEMISGNIGSASLRRLDYTVIGDAVNIAQRLQSKAGPGQILINQTTFERVKNDFICSPVGEMNLKNKSKAMQVYEVLKETTR